MRIDPTIDPKRAASGAARLFESAGAKIPALARRLAGAAGAPVFTVEGKYTSRGWTEWTQGFQFGSALLCFEATGERKLLDLGRTATLERMAGHLTHVGVHDHGFNNLSTYGNLLRLMNRGKIEENAWERAFYELALKVSGAVQAGRWTELPEGLGYIHSFNGPHSLFADTIRSLRSLAVSHRLGHVLMGERDRPISLLGRALRHAETTARFIVFYGAGRDAYDERGRVAHEAIFNTTDGSFRCPSSQQGYSPFSTWTRGLAWILLGFAEQLDFLRTISGDELEPLGLAYAPDAATLRARYLEVASAAADFYIDRAAASDGIPYWDTGAPGLQRLGDWRGSPADPFNDEEPVDASAAAIAAQGLVRLGLALGGDGGDRYLRAGLQVASVLLDEPYLSVDPRHEGLLLHSIYHRPNGWDHVPAGKIIPSGESSMWGDYHLLELALLLKNLDAGKSMGFLEAVR